MIKHLLPKLTLFFSIFLLTTSLHLHAQKTVFADNFNTSFGENFRGQGQIGTSKWAVTSSGNGGYSARIHVGVMTVTNNGLKNGVANGWVLSSTSTVNNPSDPTSYNPDYKTTLNQNVGIVSWTFNIRQSFPDPGGFGNGNNQYGVAYILAGTPNTSNAVGQGYAIQIGGDSGNESLRLVRYTNGMSNAEDILTSQTSGPTKVGYSFMSVRVEYNPQTEEWKLFARVDKNTSNASTSNFQNPSNGLSLKAQGTHTNSYTNTPLPLTGGFWNGGNTSNDAFIDNVEVKVVVPEILSITPSSTTAKFSEFTLTVTGKNFKNGDQIYWNGNLRTTTFSSATQLSAQIPATDIENAGTANITVKRGTTFTTNAVPFIIQPAQTPILVLPNTILGNMETTEGTPSASQSYTISANNLTTGVTVTAPDNFELSKSDSGPWSSTLSLAKQAENAGGLLGTPVTIFARLTGSTAGVFSGNISHAATGAITKNVSVSGRVLAIEPGTPASNISFSNISSTSFKVDWTIGSGENRLLIVKKAAPVNTLPTDGVTYFEGVTFGTGSNLGTGNFVVYNDSGNSVTVTGLEPSTNYHVSVIEFNGSAGSENYRSVHVPGNTTTLIIPVGLQIFATNTSYKINFDQTLDGINVDNFQGSGMKPSPTAGQLDSDAWAFSGFSGGALAFGGTNSNNSSYKMGSSTGNVQATGIYGFNVGTGAENYTLGIQPGGTDFNPGTITLKIRNQNAAIMTSVNIGYKVYVYNDQPASSKIAFNYSSDQGGINGYSVADASIDVISPTSADLAPGWKAYYRVKTITGLNIAKGSYFYIRWSGSLASGTGAQDEFAIDDIEVIANPTTNNVAFEGIAEDFVLAGNAKLSADLSVENRLVFNVGKLAINDNTLTIAGSVINSTENGLTGGTTSKIIVRGIQNPSLSFDQTAGANIFNSLSLIGANPNTVTALNNFSVNDLVSVDEQQILNLGITTLFGDLTSILNNGTIQTQNTTATPFNSGKTWGGTGILNMNAASAPQTLVAGTYNNLTLSSTGGTTAAADFTVNGILDLPAANASATKGSLAMGDFVLTMGENGINTGIGDVTGIIKRNDLGFNKLYTFGHPNTSISFPPNEPGGTLPSTMSIKLSIGSAVTWKTTPVLRSVDIIQTGGTLTKAIIRQHYLDSELNGNAEPKLVFWGKGGTEPEFEQGRSSINTVMNWVEITNANVGKYFTGTFGQVRITLDETEEQVLTWNGLTSTNWITTTNWTPNGVPSASKKVIIPNVSTTLNRSPIIDGTSEVKSINIEAGGVVNTPSGSILTVFDGAGAWQNNGTFNPNTGTVIFNNIDATISGSTTFNNLTIATGKGLLALEGNYMSIAGNLTNGGTMFTTLIPNTIEFKGTNQIIPNVNGLDFGGYHNLIVSGSGAAFESGYNLINLRGNLTLNQAVLFTGKTINLAGISDQTIGGTAAINFINLIVNKETGAVLLAKDINVDGKLTLTKGNVVIGDKNLTLGSSPVEGTFGNNSMIVADGAGFVRRPYGGIGSYLFPIGELMGAPYYSPITVNVTAGSFSDAFVAVNTKDEKHPNNYSTENFIRHYWNVQQTGITGALATITAKYETLDINGPEDQIAAAQLTGEFNAQNNPWFKFVPFVLGSNTLTAENAILKSGKTSVFTGLKAAAFSVEVEGFGDFCIGSTNIMNAVTSGGDAPFIYNWSNGLPNAAEVLLPTSVAANTNYTLTVIDANGFSATDTNIPVEIFPASVGGSVSQFNQTICAGPVPNDLKLTGSTGKILYWQKSTVADFATFENISNFTTMLTGLEIGPISETTYIRAALQNGDCPEVFSDIATITIKSTTWTGTWPNGIVPDASTSVVFDSDYNTSSGAINTCSCEVNAGVTLTVNPGSPLTIQYGINNNGTIIVESDANLIQVNDVKYKSGPNASFTVKRNANIKRQDYVYWSSPVEAQKMTSFSSQTVKTRFLEYNEGTDKFSPVQDIDNATFTPAKGYAVRAPNNHNFPAGTIAPWMGNFRGKPNNGKLTFNLNYKSGILAPPDGPGDGYNLVGNPYPSNIKLNKTDLNGLFDINSQKTFSLAYFWTNVAPNVGEMGSAYTGENYAMYNLSGGNSGASGNTEEIPDGTVKVGQGFIVKAKTNGQNLEFNNAMRSDDASIFFDRKANTEKDRYWLTIKTPNLNIRTLLVAYIKGATDGFEYNYDAPLLDLSSDAFFSILNDRKLGIQGRKYPLNTDDVVDIGTNHYTTGNHVISIQKAEGIFAKGQNIYLKDKQTNTITNLSVGDYTFKANAGLTDGRFEIIYKNDIVLGIDNVMKEELIVYREGTDFIVKSPTLKITDLEVYDMSGRMVIQLKPNQKEVRIDGSTMVNGTYIIKINQDGKITTRKIIR